MGTRNNVGILAHVRWPPSELWEVGELLRIPSGVADSYPRLRGEAYGRAARYQFFENAKLGSPPRGSLPGGNTNRLDNESLGSLSNVSKWVTRHQGEI